MWHKIERKILRKRNKKRAWIGFFVCQSLHLEKITWKKIETKFTPPPQQHNLKQIANKPQNPYTMSKTHLPIAITERHIKFWLVDHTGWILRDWDGSCEQMRNAIDDGAYQGKPYMLYAGNREYRHKLHKKLGSNFSHASVNLDDGSRVMIIVNNPGSIYTYNDHAVCFFEYSSNFYSRKVATAAAALEQQVRSALDKMDPRGVAAFLPQQQYESKSAADERKDAAQTINKWRERANRMIGHTE